MSYDAAMNMDEAELLAHLIIFRGLDGNADPWDWEAFWEKS